MLLFAFGEPQVKGRDDLAVDLHSTVIGSHRYADSGGREAAQVVFEPSDLRSGRRAALTDGVLNAPDKGREALSNIDLRGACLECLGVRVRQDQSRLGAEGETKRNPCSGLGVFGSSDLNGQGNGPLLPIPNANVRPRISVRQGSLAQHRVLVGDLLWGI